VQAPCSLLDTSTSGRMLIGPRRAQAHMSDRRKVGPDPAVRTTPSASRRRGVCPAPSRSPSAAADEGLGLLLRLGDDTIL
jgi:hypothetical protein